MQTTAQNPDPTLQAVFSVCASPEVSASALIAVDAVPGSAFVGEFQQYITADTRPEFSRTIKEALGCVALIDCDQDPELALETMEKLRQIFLHKVSLVAVSTRTDAPFLLRAMRAGCSDFLSKPIEALELASALGRFQTAHTVAAKASQSRGRMICFYGVKGGVGNTTLAVHLAIHLVRRQKKVLLIDHKHALGHVALHLGIKQSSYYFDGMLKNADRLDPELLEGLVTRHPSGLDVIPSADTNSVPYDSAAAAIERSMDFLKRHYDFILIDSTMHYHQAVAPLLAAADLVALVATPDVAALRDLVRHIESLSLTDGFSAKLRVIVNRSTSDDAVPASEIEKLVRFPVTMSVPNNFAELTRALNSGEPISPQSRGAFTQAVARWASVLAEDKPAVQQPEEKKKFAFWR